MKEKELDRSCVEGNGVLRDVLEGRMLGNRSQGRPRMGMIDELRKVMMKGTRKIKESFGSMKRRAKDRERWKVFVPRNCRKAEN